MDFRLLYRRPLKPNGDKDAQHHIRRRLHPQIRELWKYPPLNVAYGETGQPVHSAQFNPDFIRDRHKVNGVEFVPLVIEKPAFAVTLDIPILRPEQAGYSIILQGGDIDNRLKTLFDALRTPSQSQELPNNYSPCPDETPLYCLLEDDRLITSVAVTMDRLLDPQADPNEVFLTLRVQVKPVQ